MVLNKVVWDPKSRVISMKGTNLKSLTTRSLKTHRRILVMGLRPNLSGPTGAQTAPRLSKLSLVPLGGHEGLWGYQTGLGFRAQGFSS